MQQAKNLYKADAALVYTSHKQDPKKNPLTYENKISILEKLFIEKYPELTVVQSDDRNIMDVLISLNQTFSDIIIVAGGDRTNEYEKLLNKYNGKEYAYKSIRVLSAGDRNADKASVEGMSASKLRDAVQSNDYETFKKGIDSNDGDLVQELWNDLKRGMKMLESAKDRKLKEQDEQVEQETTTASQQFLDRVQALYNKAGEQFQIEDEVEQPDVILEPSEEGKLLDEQYPLKDPSSYTGTVGVLLIDHVLGTKFLTTYIGRFYEIFASSVQGELGGVRVVLRKLKDYDEDQSTVELMNLKVAWDSEIGNPSYHLKKENMRIDFAVEETEQLLRQIKGDVIYLTSLGALTAEQLQEYVSTFQEEAKRLKLEPKRLDATSLQKVLAHYKMVALGNQTVTKEKEATEILNGYAANPKQLTKKEIDNFSKKFGVDSRIIANYLHYKEEITWKREKSKPRQAGEFETAFKELGDTLGITPLLTLIDIQGEHEEEAKDKRRALKALKKGIQAPELVTTSSFEKAKDNNLETTSKNTSDEENN